MLNPCLAPSLWEPPAFHHNWDANKFYCGNFGALASKIASLVMDRWALGTDQKLQKRAAPTNDCIGGSSRA